MDVVKKAVKYDRNTIMQIVMVVVFGVVVVGLLAHDILYYNCFGHVCGSITIWLATFMSHKTLASRTNDWNLSAFCACIASVFFYSGREFRDLEKLKRMDWYGLLMPVMCSLVLSMAIVVKHCKLFHLNKMELVSSENIAGMDHSESRSNLAIVKNTTCMSQCSPLGFYQEHPGKPGV